MTSEERAEKKRIEKRLENAANVYYDALKRLHLGRDTPEDNRLRHKASVMARRIYRMNATLRGYD